jgi:hypothetical protein
MTPKYKIGDHVYYIGYERHSGCEQYILPAVVKDFNEDKIMLWCTEFFNKGLKITEYSEVFKTIHEAEHEIFVRATTKKKVDWIPLIIYIAVFVIGSIIISALCK